MTTDTSLPASWAQCTLGEVVPYGSTQKAEPTEIPADAWVLELEDIEKGTSKILQRLTFAQRKSKSTKNLFSAGDVLYGKLRPYLNKVVHADEDGYCTTEIIPLKPPEAVVGGYLFCTRSRVRALTNPFGAGFKSKFVVSSRPWNNSWSRYKAGAFLPISA